MKYVSYAQTAYSLGNQAWSWYQGRKTWTVAVGSQDEMFTYVMSWLEELSVGTKQFRAISFRDYTTSTTLKRVIFAPETSVSHNFELEGNKISVRLDNGKPSKGISVSEDAPVEMTLSDGGLIFTANSEAGASAVKEKLAEVHRTYIAQDNKPRLWMPGGFSSWTMRNDLPIRPMSSVILVEGQLERLADDLGKFLDAESRYTDLGVPYHRGYMLHGPPGTGKSSAIMALAGHFELDLWFLSLGDLKEDTSLLKFISDIDRKGILLLEDIDRASSNVSAAALFNALDGVMTPHGLITVMTTNDKDNIDPTLIRKGRIDVEEYVGLPNLDQVIRLWYSFFPGEKINITEIDSTKSMSFYYDIFKTYMDSPEEARLILESPVWSSDLSELGA